jgi:hypothetical protein
VLAVRWIKCAGGVWCELEKVNVASSPSSGPFVVWVGGKRPQAVRVGCGRAAEVVRAQRHDARVLRYRMNGTLYVTWAALPDYEAQGATIYLSRMLRPAIADRLPEVGMVEVTLPWMPSER